MKLRIIGYTDTINTCDCCGKVDLKGVYVMADEFDNEFYYGSVCGAKASNISIVEFNNNVKVFKSEDKKLRLLNDLLSNVKSSYDERNILRFIRKNSIDLNSFILKHGVYVETINDFAVYDYGYESFNILIKII